MIMKTKTLDMDKVWIDGMKHWKPYFESNEHRMSQEEYQCEFTPSKPPLLICSGSQTTATYFARHMNIARNEWKYVSAPEHIYGHRGYELIFVEDYWRNRRWREIGQVAEAYEMKVRYF